MARFGKKTTYVQSHLRQSKARKARKHMPRVLRVILALVGLALLILPVLLLADPISYVPLIMALFLVVLSWAYVRLVARAVSVRVAQNEFSCERGAQAGFTVALSNRSILPAPRVELEFFMTDLFGDVAEQRTLVCSLGSSQNVDAVFDVRFNHLGKYEAGIDEVRIYDLLGLFSKTQKNPTHDEVLVRPAPVTLTGVDATQVMPDESMHMLKPIASDNEDYSSVREYQRGDPMKTVHWNLSSRFPNSKMFTRLYEEYVNPSLVIVVDCFSPDYDADTQMSLFDGIVEVASALCVQAQTAGVDAEVRYINSNNEKAAAHLANENDVIDLIDHMHRITAVSAARDDAHEVEDMLRAAGLQTNGFGNVAFVTSRADEGCLEALTAIRMRRRNAMAFVAVPRELEGRSRAAFWAPFVALESSDVVCYSVESTPIGTEVSAS